MIFVESANGEYQSIQLLGISENRQQRHSLKIDLSLVVHELDACTAAFSYKQSSWRMRLGASSSFLTSASSCSERGGCFRELARASSCNLDLRIIPGLF
ncbi:hypothetical protein OUZ56_007617 [Daphnia magna]|uniref:Uncharacterized protein n=1 Tax=Daphnia magna TaxID=35525 RepID=A0ABR0AAT2_9CRUS|nr:hypothetical protein OUZ56_007617 [Daphnia magna]